MDGRTVRPGEGAEVRVDNPAGLDPDAPDSFVTLALYCGRCGAEITLDVSAAGGLVEATCVCGAEIRLDVRRKAGPRQRRADPT